MTEERSMDPSLGRNYKKMIKKNKTRFCGARSEYNGKMYSMEEIAKLAGVSKSFAHKCIIDCGMTGEKFVALMKKRKSTS